MDALPALAVQMIADQLVAMTEGAGREADRAWAAAALVCAGSEACTTIGEWLFDALDPGCLVARQAEDAHVARLRARISDELSREPAPPELRFSSQVMYLKSKVELVEDCVAAGVPKTGSKEALIRRLQELDHRAVAVWRARRDAQMEIMIKPVPGRRRCPVRPCVRKLVRAVRKNDMNITAPGALARYHLMPSHLAQLPSETRRLGGRRVQLYDLGDVIRLRNKMYGVGVGLPPDEDAIVRRRALKRKRESDDARRSVDRLSALLADAGISREEATDVSPRAAGAISAYLQGRTVPTLEKDVAHAAECLWRRSRLLRALAHAGCHRVAIPNALCEEYIRGESAHSAAQIAARLNAPSYPRNKFSVANA